MQLSSFLPNKFTAPPGVADITALLKRASERESCLLNEYEVYDVFTHIGMALPEYAYVPMGEDATQSLSADKKYVAKASIPGCIHKTDIGGISFNVTKDTCMDVMTDMHTRLSPEWNLEGVLFTEMTAFHTKGMSNGEILISAYDDPAFGPCLAFGSGGTTVEYMKGVMRPNQSALFLPVSLNLRDKHIRGMIESLPMTQYLVGSVRGVEKQCAVETVIDTLEALQGVVRYFSRYNPEAPFIINELEINPAVVSKKDGSILALDGVLSASVNPSFGIASPPLFFGSDKPLHKCSQLLNPGSVAIVGVSGKNMKASGTVILDKLIKAGEVSPDCIYPVHPKSDDILGVKCHKSMADVVASRDGKPVDLMIVGVPARSAAGIVSEAMATHQCESMFILSGGFAETEAGKEDEDRLKVELSKLSNDVRPVINGPNTLGFLYNSKFATDPAALTMDTVFVPAEKSSRDRNGHGNAAFICQSGAFMISRLSDLAKKVSPAVSVSVGNQLDLSVTDVMDYLIHSDETPDVSVYGLYIEGLNDGDGCRLMQLVAEARAKGKITVIYRAGRSAQGKGAVQSHTASMAGDYDMFKGLLLQSGAVVVDTLKEWEDTMILCSTQGDAIVKACDSVKAGAKLNVAALSNAGYEKCAIADHLFSSPEADALISLPEYSEESTARIQAMFDKHRLTGVVDVTPILDTTPMPGDEGYEDIIRATLDAEEVHMGLYSIVPETHRINSLPGSVALACGVDEDMTREDSVVQRLIKLQKAYPHKPLVVCFESGYKYNEVREYFTKHGITCFMHVDAAAKTIMDTCCALMRGNKY